MIQPADTFKEEAYERLSELESALLELEEAPSDQELIGRIFRALHTIKGSGAMFGFDEIAAFTHDVETVFDLIRTGRIPVEKELIDLTLRARDLIHTMLDGGDSPQADKEYLIASFKKFIPDTASIEVARPEAAGAQPAPEVTERTLTYRIRFRPLANLFATGTNPILLLNELRCLGTASVKAHLDLIPPLPDIDPEECYTYWDIVLSTDKGLNAVKDVFVFVEDISEVVIDVIDKGDNDVSDPPRRLGEIFVERGDVRKEDLEKTLREKKPIGELLVDAGLVTKDKVESALLEQAHVKEARNKRLNEEAASSIRVAAGKLDLLVNLVGELVTVQARLTQQAAAEDNPELVFISEEVERLTEELRDTTMSIRMLPIGTTFSKFKRLVRDLSTELGKEIELCTEGAETELDKTVIERLNDPLIHIIRNSIDHGVEPPALRESLGKPRQGRLNLSAKHSGAYVLIEITDDGAGLDRERIRAKAVERGLIAHDAEISDKDLYALIFAPGFSTAEKVTNVSGRGVGMDVVRKTIDALRGSVEVRSEKGMGTTISLRLPLTLAIIEGLLVKIGMDHFVLPLSAVEECVELTGESAARTHGRHMADVRGNLIPYVRLREEFRINGKLPDREQIVITEIDRNKIGFVVDRVIGQHQTVIKSLGKVYRDVEGISGATILGDGTVALIMDTVRLQQIAEKRVEKG
jgi:two-component system, chemotaxis family, sensor kinase CheA